MDDLHKTTDDIYTLMITKTFDKTVEDVDTAALLTRCTYLLGLFYIIGVMVAYLILYKLG